MSSLTDFQKKFAYVPKTIKFQKLLDLGIELQLVDEVGLIEVSSIGALTEVTLERLLNVDGTNNYNWPSGIEVEGGEAIHAYKDLSEDMISICCTIYCLQWPTKLYTVDELIWLFVVYSEAMMSTVSLTREVMAKATPLLQMEPLETVPLELQTSSQESESNLQENTDLNLKSS